MNLLHHPELLDQIAASYALGTLRHGARRRFETMARAQAPVRAAALIWQSRLASLAELQPEDSPSPAVWKRIENLLAAEERAPRPAAIRPQAAPATSWWHNLNLWRGLAALGTAATVAAVLVGAQRHTQLGRDLGAQIAALQTRLQSAPRIEYVAVLEDERSTASVLVTFDPANSRLTVKRVGDYREASGKSLELWALPPGGTPRSLGVMTSAPVTQLPVRPADLASVPAIAITLEPAGGVPPGSPATGPILFKGPVLNTL
jgi:anti-sigma-K factor RskA